MNGTQIAAFVEIFNIITVCAVCCLALCGALSLASRKFGFKAFRGGMFLTAFGVACVLALCAEATFFNYQRYLNFYAGSQLVTTGISPDDPNVILTSDGTRAEFLTVNAGDSAALSNGIIFKNLDRNVTSVFADIDFGNNETVRMDIMWSDNGRIIGYSKTLYRGLRHENHAIIQPDGDLSELTLIFRHDPDGSPVGLISVAINSPIPFYFSGIRLLVVSLLFFALMVFLKKDLRARASYCLFEYKFNAASKKQKYVFAALVALLILFSWVCVYTTPATYPYIKGIMSEQYNKYIVDAFLNGRTWLDYGEPEALLDVDPSLVYNRNWLLANGYRSNVHFVGDWVWYKGKFYCYYGVVPVVLFFVPYKIITGDYLSLYPAMFLFVSAAVCFLALLWWHCAKKYMPNARFAFFMLSFAALFFTAGFFYLLRYPSVWTIVQAAGIMFTSAGVFLLLKSVENEKVDRLKLFFACLCFAFAVGSRPNLVLMSLLVPLVLWRYRSWKLLAFIAVPYAMVAVPMCVYNYVRFESVTEFGIQFTHGIRGGFNNPVSKALKDYIAVVSYLFLPNTYSLYFPFVKNLPLLDVMTQGAFISKQHGCGLINYPVVFCLFYLFKKGFRRNAPKRLRLPFALVGVGTIMMLAVAYIAVFHGRYMADFTYLIILASLFCAYFWCDDGESVHLPKTRMKVSYVLLAASIVVGLFLFVSGDDQYSPHDPTLYRYLEYSLGILRDI